MRDESAVHSHDDGVIHMEPAVSSEAGRNATVGLYFAYLARALGYEVPQPARFAPAPG
jgi:hypothetical protein